MIQYTVRRLLLSIPVLIGILIVTFALARMIPGDPCKAMLGEKATIEVCERFRLERGLDDPITTQFMVFLKDVLRGDFGQSIRYSRPVTIILVERLPMTIELGSFALLIAVLVGIPAGVLSAVKRNSAIDVTTMIGANVGVSMPVYWLGLMLAFVFAILLKDTPFWLPPSGRLSAGVTAFILQGIRMDAAKETFIYHAAEFYSIFIF